MFIKIDKINIKVQKTILFLGGNGFLGDNILNHYLVNEDFKDEFTCFIVVSRTVREKITSRKNIIHVYLDFSDSNSLEKLFINYSFDEVFHFISSTVPKNSNLNIKKDIKTTLLGTVSLLNLMLKYEVSKITYISSGGTVYGETKKGGSREEDFNSPNNSYGIIKLTIEKYIILYSKLYGINYLIIRLSNPYGIFHSSDENGFINIAIRKALKNEKVIVWGNGLNTKDYIFVKDFSRIFWQLYNEAISNITLNVGSERLLSLNEILIVIKEFLPNLKWDYDDSKTFDTPNVEFSLNLLKKNIQIEFTDFKKSIAETIEWELNQYKGKK